MDWYIRNQNARRYFTIFKSDLLRIVKSAFAWGKKETGGDLFGLFTHAGRAVIMYASSPGKHAHHHAASFRQDLEYFRKIATFFEEKFSFPYIGGWHYHGNIPLNEPSAGDQHRLFSLAERNHIPHMIEIILTQKESQETASGSEFPLKQNSIRVNTFLYFCGDKEQVIRCALRVIPTENPIRSEAEQMGIISPEDAMLEEIDVSEDRIEYDHFEKEIDHSRKDSIPDILLNQFCLLPDAVLEKSNITVGKDCWIFSFPTPSQYDTFIQYSDQPPYKILSIHLGINSPSIDITADSLPSKGKIHIDRIYQNIITFLGKKDN